MQHLMHSESLSRNWVILTKVAPVPDGYDLHERILLDKELMEGTSTKTIRIGSEEERVTKVPFICKHLYPRG